MHSTIADNNITTTSTAVPFNEAKSYSFLKEWVLNGSGNRQFHYPIGIDIDSLGNVYVVDSSVQKFDSNGTFITILGDQGLDFERIDYANSIAVDSSGNVYVTDSNNNRIQKFDTDGHFITKWGKYGSANGQFNDPNGIAVNSARNVYVADSGNNRIQVFSPSPNK